MVDSFFPLSFPSVQSQHLPVDSVPTFQSIALHKRKFGVDNETTAHIFLNFQKVDIFIDI